MPTAVTKPVLPPLQTPKTASFPSEIISATPTTANLHYSGGPLSAVLKQEGSLKTPITPPTAYMDFLKALTPVLASPPASASALHRSLSDESTTTTHSLTSNPSTTGSSCSFSFTSTTAKSDGPSFPAHHIHGLTRKHTPATLKRLRIPHSPASATTAHSSATNPLTANSMHFSPYTPSSATWSASYSGVDKRYFDSSAGGITTPRSAKPVSVRSVVTRTVTYKRSPPLEPAPKGKKRKVACPPLDDDVTPAAACAKGATEASDIMPPPSKVVELERERERERDRERETDTVTAAAAATTAEPKMKRERSDSSISSSTSSISTTTTTSSGMDNLSASASPAPPSAVTA